MKSGKLASQAGHAFVGAIENCEKHVGEGGWWECRSYDYKNGTKVVLEATLEQILEIETWCKNLGYAHHLVIDEHHICPPHFDGSPIITALGIGPLLREESKILKHLKLVT